MLRQQVCTLTHYFPTASPKTIKKCLKELFQYDTATLKQVNTILTDLQQVKKLRELPLVPQRSKEWYEMREGRLTASDLAQAMGKGKFGNRKELLAKKSFPDKYPFKTMAAMKWGTMMEDVGMRCYREGEPENTCVYEFGLIAHDSIKCFGASPDGITNTGIMVEMKCPYSRQCSYEVPEQYYLQIQGQLATCKLNLCHYVECYFDTFIDLEEYELSCQNNGTKGHGVVLEMPDESYVYSPEGLDATGCVGWVKEQPRFKKATYWKLKLLFKKEVPFDIQCWEGCLPDIYKFWSDVENERKAGYRGPEPLTKKELDLTTKYTFIEDSDED